MIYEHAIFYAACLFLAAGLLLNAWNLRDSIVAFVRESSHPSASAILSPSDVMLTAVGWVIREGFHCVLLLGSLVMLAEFAAYSDQSRAARALVSYVAFVTVTVTLKSAFNRLVRVRLESAWALQNARRRAQVDARAVEIAAQDQADESRGR
jgi:hypothetical protein